ncbi:hypothetical protein MRQ36_05215 [Micromonospora sp. R77]|uniref:DUF7660 family protein n=1 Tax=Micromonospora sp. R77 TaxID=2925836 RepID=UPI001F60C09A|nr:hypothetical protein [Micromonospora sp. R77]MCI4061996.1 hypothetical protein [Micromonospora sp. R77]
MSRHQPYGRFAEVDDPPATATRRDIADLVDDMLEDLVTHPDEWENATLESFLGALARSLDDIDGRYANQGRVLPDQPTWQLVGELLVMASGYE